MPQPTKFMDVGDSNFVSNKDLDDEVSPHVKKTFTNV